MRNEEMVRVEVNNHLEKKMTYDVFGIVRGSIEPGNMLTPEIFNVIMLCNTLLYVRGWS